MTDRIKLTIDSLLEDAYRAAKDAMVCLWLMRIILKELAEAGVTYEHTEKESEE